MAILNLTPDSFSDGGRALDTDVKLNDEAEEFVWLTPAEALKLPLNSPTRVLLDEALARHLIPHANA
jgi:hypothetical protein